MPVARALLVPIVLVACAGAGARSEVGTGPGEAHAPGVPATIPESHDTAANTSASGTQTASAAEPSGSISFLKDDVEGALARARSERKALFVDAWAEWCHTCLSMQHYVFVEPSLKPLEKRVVFLAIDTEREQNAKFLERYAVNVWPTLFVIEPVTGKVAGYWPGAASLAELRSFLDGSLEVIDALGQAGLAPDSPLLLLVEAKAATAAGDPKKASALYERAVERAPRDWSRRNEALLGLITSYARSGNAEKCVAVGLRHSAEVTGAALPVDFVSTMFDCSQGLKNPGKQREVRTSALARLRELTDKPPADASTDDRADALDKLSSVLFALGDKQAAREAQERRLALMEAAARTAKTPEAAATHDYGRANAYVALGRPEEAIRMLEERERQLPVSYDPPGRLARVLARLKRWQPALAAVDRALKNAYGPRRLGYLELKADIQRGLGDRRGEVKTLEELVAGHQALSAGQANKGGLPAAKKRLAAARSSAPR
jgi:tetratricopeptide (TPR) repeat protein